MLTLSLLVFGILSNGRRHTIHKPSKKFCCLCRICCVFVNTGKYFFYVIECHNHCHKVGLKTVAMSFLGVEMHVLHSQFPICDLLVDVLSQLLVSLMYLVDAQRYFL